MAFEKSRIMELVEQGLLTTEEALVLLENQSKKAGAEEAAGSQLSDEDADVLADFFTEQGDQKAALEIKQKHYEAEQKAIKEKLGKLQLDMDETILTEGKDSEVFAQLTEKQEALQERYRELATELALLKQAAAQPRGAVENSASNKAMAKEIGRLAIQLVREKFKQEPDPARVKQLESQIAELKDKIHKENAPEGDDDRVIIDLDDDEAEDLENEEATGNIFSEMFADFDGEEWRNDRIGWQEAIKITGQKIKDMLKGTIQVKTDKNGLHVNLFDQNFAETYRYPDTDISVVRLKLNRGDVRVSTWDRPDIELNLSGQVYGRYQNRNARKTLEKRSVLLADEESLRFEAKSHFIYCDVELKVPENTLDYLSIETQLGDLEVQGVTFQDAYVKTMTGDINLEQVSGQNLEMQTKTGDIRLTHGDLKELSINSMTGDIKLLQSQAETLHSQLTTGDFRWVGRVKNITVTGQHGDIFATIRNADVREANFQSRLGDVKINVPSDTAVAGLATTRTGEILFRHPKLAITSYPTSQGKHVKQFSCGLEQDKLDLNIETSHGDIWFKADA